MCLSSQFPISISVIQFPTPAHVITAVHSSCALNVDPLILKSPPSVAPRPVGSFIWMPFDRPEHALGHGKDDNDFNKDDTCRMTASIPKCANSSMSPQVMVKYYLHRHGQDDSILAGSSVLSRESICPPFESCPTTTTIHNHTYVRAISTYDFTRCFRLVDNIQYRMSHERYKFGLDLSMPGRTSSLLFDQVYSHLLYLRDANCEVFSPNQFAAPVATIQTLVNLLSSLFIYLHSPSLTGEMDPSIN